MFKDLNYIERFGLVAWLTLLSGIGLLIHGAVNATPMDIYMYSWLVLTLCGLCLVALYHFIRGVNRGMNDG